MHRFFADETGIRNGLARLEAEDAAHALRVLRLKPGDDVQLYSGGEAYSARITDTADGVTVRILDILPSPEPGLRVTLYQGVPKGDKMDYIVQKCTEAGIGRIVPVNMPRCVARLEKKDEKKLTRWRRIAREAAKQAFRPVTPEIGEPLGMEQLPQMLKNHQLALVPWEDAREGTLRQLITPALRDLALVIGPEGGMSPEDVAPLFAAGAVPVTLGRRIFRTETAGLAALIGAMAFSHNLE